MFLDEGRTCGKNRRKGKKESSHDRPHFIAMSPVATVTQPPIKKRSAYSEGFVLRRASSWRLTNTAFN